MPVKVSVVTSVLNAEGTIASCCWSVARQLTEWHSGRIELEHVLIDGASRDDTVRRAKGFQTVSKIVSEPDRGMYCGMNKGLRYATGDIIAILNADDFYLSEDTIVRVVETMEQKDVDTCYGNVIYVNAAVPDQIHRVWHSGPYRRKRFLHGWMPPHPAFFVRRECYERYGLYREDMSTAADYELMLRLLMREQVSSCWIPDLWVAMRSGGLSNASVMARLRANRMDRSAWRMNGLKSRPWTAWIKPARKLPQYLRRQSQDAEQRLAAFWGAFGR